MDISDWPVSDALRPITPLRVGVNVPKSGFKGFYTGNRETSPHLADRMTLQVTLPPCTSAQAAEREAYLFGAISRGDAFRFGAHHRPVNSGTLRGSPTVASNALAGARSITLAGAAGRNLLTGGSFEVDTDANGVGNGWAAEGFGTFGSLTPERVPVGPSAAPNGTYVQQLVASGLGSTGSDKCGFSQSVAFPANTAFALQASFQSDPPTNLVASLQINWTGGSGFISASAQDWPMTAGHTVRMLTGTSPSGATGCTVYVLLKQTSGSTISAGFNIDAVQLEAGAAHDFERAASLLAGDFLSIGGNLLHIGYAGSVANDAGAMTVPLTLPLQKPLTAGAAVTASSPQGVWDLDLDGIDLDYLSTWMQDGVTLPFIQRIV